MTPEQHRVSAARNVLEIAEMNHRTGQCEFTAKRLQMAKEDYERAIKVLRTTFKVVWRNESIKSA